MSSILRISPVIPVVVFDEPDAAVDLAHALVAGGIAIIELTLRTPRALAVIERIASSVPGITIGAGTVLDADHARAAADAGAGFLVSPGSTPRLLEALRDTALPVLPGASTASEVLALRDEGFTELKFFPAEYAGGVAFLGALAGPIRDVQFCPTGGITLEKAPNYLALPNVATIGGTWITPPQVLADHDWAQITALAAEARALRQAQ